MRTTTTTWAMLIALLTAVSCTETETGIEPEPGNGGDGQVALGINPNLKVEAGMKSETKAVVSGTAITYTDYNTAPGLGVVVTNKEATGWYTPDGGNGGYSGHHIWYMGDGSGKNWKSIGTNKAADFNATAEKPYYLTKEVGQVYAYYPYDANNFTGNETSITAASLKIPVAVVTTGAIDASTNNASKSWNGSEWVNNTDKNKKQSVDTEKDYLYFANETGYGRYVNNGHAAEGPTYDPNAEPDNTIATNPGYKIKLDMKHAMTMLSFRVYDGGDMSTNTVTFEKFQIKNADGGSSPFKTGSESMSLVDGVITKTSSAGNLVRTITGYTLMKQIESGGTEDASKFVSTGTGTSKVNGQTVSKSVSALVYPISDGFSDGDIEVVISLKDGSNAAVNYTVALPGISWEPGENYIYTFMAGRNKLTVMDVTVTDWHDMPQQEIPL